MFFYTNKDYTVRIKEVDGCEKYFIRFHGQVSEPEIEVTIEFFMLYVKEFNKPMERWMNEQRRHIDDGGLDDFDRSGQLSAHTKNLEQQCVTNADLDAALKTCTAIQQRRFSMYYIQDYTFTQIAGMESCDEAAVRRSISAALKKIKKYFFWGSPNLSDF